MKQINMFNRWNIIMDKKTLNIARLNHQGGANSDIADQFFKFFTSYIENKYNIKYAYMNDKYACEFIKKYDYTHIYDDCKGVFISSDSEPGSIEYCDVELRNIVTGEPVKYKYPLK